MATKRKKKELWTDDDLKALRTRAKKMTARELAKSLGRTLNAVRQKAHTEDISLDARSLRRAS